MIGSDILVSTLEEMGVEYIFGVPGEETLDLLESLRKSSIALILTRHEQTAAFMAATWGRLTGKPGVCLATCGPGALNMTTAAAYAHLGAMPMIMITGQKSIFSSPQAGFQVTDVVGTFRPITKFSCTISAVCDISSLTRNAFQLATNERRGPALLELPEDVASAECETPPPLSCTNTGTMVASPADLERVAALILSAKRPLVMLGAAANRPEASDGIHSFILKLALPFFTTQMGMGADGGLDDYFLGTAALSRNDYLHDLIANADLIISIGHDTVEKPPFIPHPTKQRILHIGYIKPCVATVYNPDDELIGDISFNLHALTCLLHERLEQKSTLLHARNVIHDRTSGSSEKENWPPTPRQIVRAVRNVMPEDGIVALDNGMYKLWFARNYRAAAPNTLLLDNMLATMGAGLPSAMTAALLYPNRRVLAVCGDGGFMMNSQDLETAVRLMLNLVVLIIDDGAYGMIRWKQETEGYADFGMTFSNPDFVQYARAYGASGYRVQASDDIANIIDTAFNAGGVHLVIVPIDYSENMTVLVEELSIRETHGFSENLERKENDFPESHP